MVHDEPWQVFAENGIAVTGFSAHREEFDHDTSLIVGASHIWLWRRGASEIEVLLQKRATTKKTWPGYYDISAAGHIDAGETPVESAVREAKEELGTEIDADKLLYLFSLRTPLAKSEIDHVYIYEVDDAFVPEFHDGEVESVEWLSLSDFQERLKTPEEHQIVNQGDGYFTLLLAHFSKL